MKKQSKYLSYLLRHSDIAIKNDGWVDMSTVMLKMKENFRDFSRSDLISIVDNDEKNRYKIDLHKNLIRANQGHSIKVNIEFEEKTPSQYLYHGTKSSNLESIFKNGILKGNRNYVHLSSDIETANIVANRRNGKSVILEIDTTLCKNPFYLSDNNVWLCDYIESTAIRIL